MKTMKFMIIAIMTVGFLASISAQGVAKQTATFKVSGNCESCKERIEKAAKIDGVFKAKWNEDSKVLTLVFNPEKVKVSDVQKKIAAAGHDNEAYKADDSAYKSLPGCCKYR